MENKLTTKQQAYYDERVTYFSALRAGGRKIAIPTGMIYDTAINMSDKECDEWFAPEINVLDN